MTTAAIVECEGKRLEVMAWGRALTPDESRDVMAHLRARWEPLPVAENVGKATLIRIVTGEEAEVIAREIDALAQLLAAIPGDGQG